MNWIRRSEWRRHQYFQGPREFYWTMGAANKRYEVSASWENPFRRGGNVVYWSKDGNGASKRWTREDHAKLWCEQDAGRVIAEKKTLAKEQAAAKRAAKKRGLTDA